MESCNLVLLNGRSKSDSPADFTFVGAQGHSVIDLVWFSLNGLPLCGDFRVLDLPTLSDHLPVLLEINILYASIKNNMANNIGRRIFDVNRAEDFSYAMAWRGEVADLDVDVDCMNNTLKSCITRSKFKK